MKRKSIYKFLVVVSLMGAVGTQVLVHSPIVRAQDFSSQKGSFIVGGVAINVRSQPSPDASLENQYQPGEKINYDQIGTANGYRWISYVGGSGQRRYVAIGTADGSQSFGSLSEDSSPASAVPLSETSGTATSSSTLDAFMAGDFSEIAGIWENAKGDRVTILPEGGIAERPYNVFAGVGTNASDGKPYIGVAQVDDAGNFMAGGYAIQYVKAGETLTVYEGAADNTDLSRERLKMGQQAYHPDMADSVFYRVAETSPAEESAAEESPAKEPVTEEKPAEAPATDNQPSASKAESTTSSSSQTIKPSSKTATKPSSSQSTTSNATATSSAPESTKSFKTFLPLTGEALSLLGFLGVGFLFLGLLGFKRRK